MNRRSLAFALFFGLVAANLQAQTAAAPVIEKCDKFSNIVTINVLPCDPPTAAEMLPPELFFSEEKFQNQIDWTQPKRKMGIWNFQSRIAEPTLDS